MYCFNDEFRFLILTMEKLNKERHCPSHQPDESDNRVIRF